MASKATPSYARSTRTSLARSHIGSTPEKLKRPSTIRNNARHRYSSLNPLRITAANSRKPCPFATLPPELRLRIYSYFLPNQPMYIHSWKREMKASPWALLSRVCQLIRAEVTYELYTHTNFEFHCIGLDNHEPLQRCLTTIPPAQRSLLTKNRNLTLPLVLRLRYDTDPTSLWTICQRFGNVYAIPQRRHRGHFAIFCRLASWWLWRAGPISKGIMWTYKIRIKSTNRWNNDKITYLKEWLNTVMQTVALPCVQKAWVRERREAEMKKEALNMLEAVDQSMQMHRHAVGLTALGDEEWDRRILFLWRFFQKW